MGNWSNPYFMIYLYKVIYLLKLWCTCHFCTAFKSKIGAKILSQKHGKTSFYHYFLNSVRFLLMPKNECVALVAFKSSVALNTWKEWHDLSTNLIRKLCVSSSPLKHNLCTDSLMVYSPAVNCSGGSFIKSF